GATGGCTTRLRAKGLWAGSQRDRGGDKGRRAAPKDCREDAGRKVPHSAHHLCRGGGRHGTGGTASRAQRQEKGWQAEADAAAFPDTRHGEGDRRTAE